MKSKDSKLKTYRVDVEMTICGCIFIEAFDDLDAEEIAEERRYGIHVDELESVGIPDVEVLYVNPVKKAKEAK